MAHCKHEFDSFNVCRECGVTIDEINRKSLESLGAFVGAARAAGVGRPGTAWVDGAPDLHWLVKDFHVLYRTAEAALAQALLDGYDTAHLRDLGMQLQRLAPAFEQCEMERRGARATRERG